MLFDNCVRTDEGPALYSEPHHTYLNRSARPEASRVRNLFEEWFARYPPTEKSELLARFRSRLDTQFTSSAFELYLHELLQRLGYTVEVHPANPSGKPTRPDFVAACPGDTRVYVEAVLATDTTDSERAARSRMNVVYDSLNRLGPTDFFLGMQMSGAPESPPPSGRLRRKLATWLRGLNADAVVRAANAGDSASYPSFPFEHAGWVIEFTAYPKSPALRGKPGIRPVGIQLSSPRMISTWEAIRGAVAEKGAKYGDLNAPLVVAVNVGGFWGTEIDEIDVMQALFGQEQYLISVNQPEAEPTPSRIANGAWTSPSGPRYRGISAVLVVANLLPWSVALSSIRLYHNPWARNRCVGPLCSLPQSRPEDSLMRCHDGIHPRELFGLPESWPYLVALAAQPDVAD